MSYRPTRLVEWAWSHPPRCLSNFAVKSLKSPHQGATVFDELGYFEISCRCGSSAWNVLGYPDPEAGLLCPVFLSCVECELTEMLFDVEEHGYDAECGNGCYSMRGEGESKAHRCSKCNEAIFAVFPGFSYQIEPVEDLPEEFQRHIQDFFDGFGLDVRCLQCGALENLVGYECA